MVMGIVNVTPDSFFPASRTVATDEAIARPRTVRRGL
jgi:dihydropteroate synthase